MAGADSDGSRFSPIRFLPKSRWILLLLLIVVLLILGSVASILFIHVVSDTWDVRQVEIDSLKSEAVEKAFRRRIQPAYTAAAELIQSYRRLLPGEEKHTEIQRDSLFGVLSVCGARHGVTVEIFDAHDSIVAYTGRPILPDSSLQRLGDHCAFVTERDYYTNFVVVNPLKSVTGTRTGSVVTAIPLEITWPLHNRFLRSHGFRADLQREMGLDLTTEYADRTALDLDGRYQTVRLHALDETTVGNAYFLKTNPATHIDFIRRQFHTVRSFLLLILMVILAILAFRWSGRLIGIAWIRQLVLILMIWAFRWLLIFLSISTDLLPGKWLDPVYFASTFGFGLTSSLGELLLSAVAFFISMIFLRRAVTHFTRVTGKPLAPSTRAVAAISIPLIGFLLPLVLRGYAASVRSFVVDSTFVFDDVGSIFQQDLYPYMLLSIFFVTAGFTLGFISLAYCQRILATRLTSSTGMARLLVAGALFIPFLLLKTGGYDMLYPDVAFLVAGILVMIISELTARVHTRSLLVRSLIYSSTLLLIFAVTLHLFNEEKRKEEVELRAAEYIRPVDGWTALLLSQSTDRIMEHQSDVLERSGGDEYSPVDAFRLWAETPLSDQPNYSAISILTSDQSGESTFSIGIPRAVVKELLSRLPNPVPDTATFLEFERPSFYPEQTLSVAVLPLFDRASHRAGTICVILVAGDKLRVIDARTDILRSTSTRRSIVPEDEFILSQFTENILRYSSDPRIPRGLRLPEDSSLSRHERDRGWWGTIAHGEDPLQTFFLPIGNVKQNEVLGVSIPRADERFTLYRFFRFGFFFLLCVLPCLVVLRFRSIAKSHAERRFSFATKLQAAMITIAAVPLLFYWGGTREFIREQSEEQLYRQISDALSVGRASIMRNLAEEVSDSGLTRQITDQVCADIASESGNEINLHVGGHLTATSKPELYATGLLSSRLNEIAYREVVLQEKDLHIAAEMIGEFRYLVGYTPLRNGTGRILAVLSTPMLFEQQSVEKEYVRATANIFLWSFIGLIIILTVSGIVANQIAKPMRALIHASRNIALGDFSGRISTRRKDEIGDFIQSFNTMTEQVSASRKELAEAERQLAWKEMAKQVAHEIRNPLTPMKLAAQHLRQAYKDGTARIGEIIDQVTNTILEQIETLSRISTAFSDFARMPVRDLHLIDVNKLLREILDMFSHHTAIRFIVSLDAHPAMVRADEDELKRCFINIIRNAVQAIPDAGSITLSTVAVENEIRITIRDDGQGIDEAVLPRIFEPNFSTKTEGMGLGLAIVKKILDDLEARITIESRVGEGTTVTVILPRDSEQGNGSASNRSAEESVPRT